MDLPAHPTAPQKHPQYSLGLTLIAGCDEIFQARLQIYPRTTLWVLHQGGAESRNGHGMKNRTYRAVPAKAG